MVGCIRCEYYESCVCSNPDSMYYQKTMNPDNICEEYEQKIINSVDLAKALDNVRGCAHLIEDDNVKQAIKGLYKAFRYYQDGSHNSPIDSHVWKGN